jgi:Glyoxalase-like domain
MAWVVAVDDISPVESRLGRSSVMGHRRRPDGVDLVWRQIGVLDLLDDPALPFFVEWQGDERNHPAFGGDGHARIERVEICGDRDSVASWLNEPLNQADFAVDWIEGDEPGLVAVHFATRHGIVRID